MAVDPRAADIVRSWARASSPAVVFDFNGTLSDDEHIVEEVFTGIFAERLGWSMPAAEYRARMLGRSDREIAEIAVAEHGSSEGDPSRLVDDLLGLRRTRYHRAVADHSPIRADTVALVTQLASNDVPMAVVTGAQRADVLAVLGGSAVGTHLTRIVAEEDVTRGKPDPEGFLRGAMLLGVRPRDVLVLEDSLPGLVAAERAGMRCIAVTGRDPLPALLDHAPATVAHLAPDLLDASGLTRR